MTLQQVQISFQGNFEVFYNYIKKYPQNQLEKNQRNTAKYGFTKNAT